MEIRQIPGAALGKFTRKDGFLCVEADAGSSAEHLACDYSTVCTGTVSLVPNQQGKVLLAVPIFWLDAQREDVADKYWSRTENSIKFKVSDGPFAGLVGYLRIHPLPSSKEKH